MTEQELNNAMTVHGDTVYRLALCRLQNTADAEDVYQDVFLRLFRQQTVGWDQEHIRAWLIRAALNRCADLGRFRQRQGTLSLEELPDAAEAADETAAELWDSVARLPEKLRIPVHLYYGEGYGTGEIAKILGVPAATIRSRLHRARLQLKNLLGGSDHEEQLSAAYGNNPCARRAE